MTAALLLSVLLNLKGPEGRYASGQAEFNRGNFTAALRHLDAAAAEAGDSRLLSQIHLLRGQAYAAKGDYDRTESAFMLALEADPEVSLDPARVDPKLVGMLDGIRDRTHGQLRIRAATLGTRVLIDGRPVGTAPVSTEVSIGRHAVEGRAPDGRRSGRAEVVVRPNRSTDLELILPARSDLRSDARSDKELKETEESATVPADAPGMGWKDLRPFADLRPAWAPAELLSGLGFEVGGGVERQFLRAGLSARLFPHFGVTPRAALHVPFHDKLEGLAELELPVLFPSSVAFGVGGAGGVEYAINHWMGAFGQAGFRYYFVVPAGFNQSQFLIQLGLRLRLPLPH